MSAAVMATALAIDAGLGWPKALFRTIGHPVTWIGALVNRLESDWNRLGADPSAARRAGRNTTLFTIFVTAGPAILVVAILPNGWAGTILTGILAAPFLATRSLFSHVRDVADPLIAGDLAQARVAVAKIVGRDPNWLDEPGVARAAIESLAENTSDGIVAPLFWGVLFGLPGITAYKAINTLDSMIGHRTERYENYGRFAAKLDDMVNWIPARLTGLIFCLLSSDPSHAVRIMRRDAKNHRSPNAGWPESAMAAALNVRLSGPRSYGQEIEDAPWLNASGPDPDGTDINAGLSLYRRSIIAIAVLLILIAFI